MTVQRDQSELGQGTSSGAVSLNSGHDSPPLAVLRSILRLSNRGTATSGRREENTPTDAPGRRRRLPMPLQNEYGSRGAVSVGRALETSLAENTRRAYRNGWRRFAAFCHHHRVDPMVATPATVAEFLVAMAAAPRSSDGGGKTGPPLALGTIRICLAAINRRFGERNLESPASNATVRSVLRGLGRLADSRPRRVKALREHEIAAMLTVCDRLGDRQENRTIAVRDAAVIAVGFAGALRRSEICELRLADVEFVEGAGDRTGMFLHIRRSKTDQLGKGQSIAIPEGAFIRPVERLRRWLAVSRIRKGPVFQSVWRGGRPRGKALHPTDIPRLVKSYAQEIGLDPDDYSGHSLRAGFVTSAAVHSARLDKIMEVTRHSNAETVLRYIRQADAFRDHAGAAFL